MQTPQNLCEKRAQVTEKKLQLASFKKSKIITNQKIFRIFNCNETAFFWIQRKIKQSQIRSLKIYII